MQLKLIVLTAFTLLHNKGFSKDTLSYKCLGLGFQIGRSSMLGDGGLSLSYFHQKNFEINLGIGEAKYRFIGAGLNIEYSPFYRYAKSNLFLGAGYTYFPDKTFSLGPDEQQITTFRIHQQHYFVPQIGLRRDIDCGDDKFIALKFFVSYRLPKFNESVSYIKGYQAVDLQSKIYNRINEKLGFGIKATLSIWRL